MAQETPTPQKTDTTGKNYALDLFYGSVKLTNHVRRLRITNSMDAGWPRIIVDLNISAEDIIKDEIYGTRDFRLDITTSGPTGDALATDTYYLMYMESNLGLVPQDDKNKSFDMRQSVIITLVPTYAINVLGSFVNAILDKDKPDDKLIPGTPLEVFQKLFLDKLGFKQINMDLSGSNKNIITEMIIPPMSVRQCLNYMDNKFVFYSDGEFFFYCNKDGVLGMWNLYHRLNSHAGVFKLYQIHASDKDDKIIKKIISSGIKDDEFYTTEIIQSNFYANAKVLNQGYANCQINKPSDRLYRFYCANMDDEQVKLDYHKNLTSRKRYFTNLTSFSGSRVKIILGESVKNISRISFTLKGTLLMKNLVRVGEPLELKPGNIPYLRYQGKYIIGTSDLTFERKDGNNWLASCTITAFRPFQAQNHPDVIIRRS